MLQHWWRKCAVNILQSRTASRQGVRRQVEYRPRVEALEDRCVLTVFDVINNLDMDLNHKPVPGSLRDGLTKANEIHFKIPGGPAQIILTEPLPFLENVILDGTTQEGYDTLTRRPAIELTANYSPITYFTEGFLDLGSHNYVHGLAINGFSNGQAQAAIRLFGDSNVIENCYLGTDLTGTQARPNNYGVIVDGSNNVIGSRTLQDDFSTRNIISGNFQDGIWGRKGLGNLVAGNWIGLQAPTQAAIHQPLGNQVGIRWDSAGTVINNVIAFNRGEGIVNQGRGPSDSVRVNSLFFNSTVNTTTGGITSNNKTFPVLTSVLVDESSGTTTINGTFHGAANSRYLLDFYANGALDAGGHGEGQSKLFTANVTTDSLGNLKSVNNDVISSIILTDGGSGYTTPPAVVIPGFSGQANAGITDQVRAIKVTHGGSGYEFAPAVSFSEPTSPGGAKPFGFTTVGGPITGITITKSGSGHFPAPKVVITGVGNGAKAHAEVDAEGFVTGVVIDNPGQGYTGGTGVLFVDDFGGLDDIEAEVTADVKLLSVTLLTRGTGYTSMPTVTIDPPPNGGSQATAVATTSVVAVNVTTPFTMPNFNAVAGPPPEVMITGGGGTGAKALAIVSSPTSLGGFTILSDLTFQLVLAPRPGSGIPLPVVNQGAFITASSNDSEFSPAVPVLGSSDTQTFGDVTINFLFSSKGFVFTGETFSLTARVFVNGRPAPAGTPVDFDLTPHTTFGHLQHLDNNGLTNFFYTRETSSEDTITFFGSVDTPHGKTDFRTTFRVNWIAKGIELTLKLLDRFGNEKSRQITRQKEALAATFNTYTVEATLQSSTLGSELVGVTLPFRVNLYENNVLVDSSIRGQGITVAVPDKVDGNHASVTKDFRIARSIEGDEEIVVQGEINGLFFKDTLRIYWRNGEPSLSVSRTHPLEDNELFAGDNVELTAQLNKVLEKGPTDVDPPVTVPAEGVDVHWTVVEGPNEGKFGTAITNFDGKAIIEYTGALKAGTDKIRVDLGRPDQLSANTTVNWRGPDVQIYLFDDVKNAFGSPGETGKGLAVPNQTVGSKLISKFAERVRVYISSGPNAGAEQFVQTHGGITETFLMPFSSNGMVGTDVIQMSVHTEKGDIDCGSAKIDWLPSANTIISSSAQTVRLPADSNRNTGPVDITFNNGIAREGVTYFDNSDLAGTTMRVPANFKAGDPPILFQLGTQADYIHGPGAVTITVDISNISFTNFSSVKIITLPAAGRLTNNGVPVAAGDLVSRADINAGRLVFTPPNGGAASASFRFQLVDAGGNLASMPRTWTIGLRQRGPEPYTLTSFSFVDVNSIQLFHFENGQWVGPRSSFVDLNNKTITATFDSLSPFAIFQRQAVVKTTHFLIRAPKQVVLGAPFTIKIVAIDGHGRRIATGYTGLASLRIKTSTGVLKPLTFKKRNHGKLLIHGLRLHKNGVNTLIVSDAVQATIRGKVIIVAIQPHLDD
jgi:hypothetical protein